MPDVYVSPEPKPPLPDRQEPPKRPTGAKNDRWKDVIAQVLSDVGESSRRARLGAYCVYPPGTRFITQQDDEEIVLLLRAHPITNVGWILLTLGMLLLPKILLGIGMFASVPDKFIFVGQLVWYLATLMYAFEKFLHWYYTVFIVTNERVVDIDFVNLLFRVVTYGNLTHIEEPAMVTGGFVRSLFQYGNVYVTTASEQPTIEALGVPWPQKVVDIISRLAEELEKRREHGE